MSHLKKIYELEKQNFSGGTRFYFESIGKQNITKTIQYSYVLNFNGRGVYNLGFGDYDQKTETVIDQVSTNNGDVYMVFNTVLNSIPLFFEQYAKDGIIVSGSDSNSDYIESCRTNCKRKCGQICKKSHRRIGIYCRYLNKNFDTLSGEYDFYGEIDSENGEILFEIYEPYKEYSSVLAFKK